MTASDADLLRTVADDDAGRDAAWSELVARHTPRLYAVARSFSIDEPTAADLVQTAWLRLIERRSQLRQPDSLGPWLCMIVRNEARRLVTRRRTVPTDQGWDRVPDVHVPRPEAAVVAGERHQAVRLAFVRLGEECRQLLRLLTHDPPLPYAEVAAAVGRPVGAIGPTRQRCLDQLRRLLPSGAIFVSACIQPPPGGSCTVRAAGPTR